MASDRGAAPDLRPGELDRAWLDGCDWLHVSGYCLVRSPIDEAAFAAATAARERGARVSLDLSAWTLIHAFGAARFRDQVERLAPNLVFANEAEWELVGGAYALAETAVVKRGSRGIAVWKDGMAENYAAAAADIVDTTGAGDALAAGFLVGGPKLGLQTAARCVAKLGAMP